MKSARQRLDEMVTEKEFTSDIIRMAKLHGWLVTHFRAALTPNGRWLTALMGDKGFPDLVLVKGEKLIFAELKTQKGVLTEEQKDWISALDKVALGSTRFGKSVAAYVWRPGMRDAIATILAAA